MELKWFSGLWDKGTSSKVDRNKQAKVLYDKRSLKKLIYLKAAMLIDIGKFKYFLIRDP